MHEFSALAAVARPHASTLSSASVPAPARRGFSLSFPETDVYELPRSR